VYVFWGSGYVGIRVMVEDIPPMLGGGLRFIASGLLLLAWSAARRPRGVATLRIDRRQLLGLSILGMLLCAASGGFLGIGEQHVTSSLAALLAASVPLWVIVLRAGAGRRPSWAVLGSALVGFGGVGLLFLPGGQDGATSVFGATLILAGALSWAVGSWIAPRLALPGDVVLATGWQMLLGGVGLAVIGLAAGEAPQLHVPALDSAVALVYLALVSGGLGYTAYVWLLHHAPLDQISTFAYVNPLVAVALGWALLGEAVSGLTLAAATLIVGSVAVTLREEPEVRERASDPPPR
jgi:drug/metabolite transporter (DMT)-like permease